MISVHRKINNIEYIFIYHKGTVKIFKDKNLIFREEMNIDDFFKYYFNNKNLNYGK